MKFGKIISLLCTLIILPAAVRAETAPKVLVLNSNASIEKYTIAHQEFKKAIPYPIVEQNLGGCKVDICELKELVTVESIDLIYCVGAKAYLTANKYLTDKNIVFSSIINWRRLPVSYNSYGVSNELHSVTQIMMFRYIFPEVTKIGILYSRKFNKQWVKQAKKQAKTVGIELAARPVSYRKHPVPVLQKIIPEIDALWLISDPSVISEKDDLFLILEECDNARIPVFSYDRVFAKYGAVLIVAVDNPTIGRQSAIIAEQLLSDGKPEVKVQYPAGSHITLNLKKVNAYGMKYNENALKSVNTIIK